MKHLIFILSLAFLLISCAQSKNKQVLSSEKNSTTEMVNDNLKLGAFSLSLSVIDLAKSKVFYENLDFEVLAGSVSDDYYIMKNENSLIGIFHGMFEGNIMTFNPGWDENGKETSTFDDIRMIQKHLKSQGVVFDLEADESTSGPASFMLKDPDGNIILMDQHR